MPKRENTKLSILNFKYTIVWYNCIPFNVMLLILISSEWTKIDDPYSPLVYSLLCYFNKQPNYYLNQNFFILKQHIKYN